MLAAFRDVYNQMIVFLAGLWIIAAFTFGLPAITNVLISVGTAFALDAGINYYKSRKFELPKSGIISGFFVGLIVPFSVTYAAVGAFLAIASKHVIVHEKRHVFNPAAFGILASSVLLNFGTSWWAATTPLLALFGVVIVHSIKRWRTAASFLAVYGLVAIADHLRTFRTMPDVAGTFSLTLLFFALFMLIEPRTSPNQNKAMPAFGALAALLALSLPAILPVDPLLGALLAANLTTSMLNTRLR